MRQRAEMTHVVDVAALADALRRQFAELRYHIASDAPPKAAASGNTEPVPGELRHPDSGSVSFGDCGGIPKAPDWCPMCREA